MGALNALAKPKPSSQRARQIGSGMLKKWPKGDTPHSFPVHRVACYCIRETVSDDDDIMVSRSKGVFVIRRRRITASFVPLNTSIYAGTPSPVIRVGGDFGWLLET